MFSSEFPNLFKTKLFFRTPEKDFLSIIIRSSTALTITVPYPSMLDKHPLGNPLAMLINLSSPLLHFMQHTFDEKRLMEIFTI